MSMSVVVDAANQVVLHAASEGLCCSAKLPAGNYQVNANYRGSVEHRDGGGRTDGAPDARLPVGVGVSR